MPNWLDDVLAFLGMAIVVAAFATPCVALMLYG